jgi:hypothetical protein
MEATRKVRADPPDNEDKFDAPFFKRMTLRPAPRPLALEDGIEKTYQFPTFYGDVGCAIGIFLCDYDAARALLPHPKLVPVRMPRGRSLVILSCYEYRQVLGVWPYNEIAMTIPVMANARLRPPVLPMLASALFPRFGYWVFGMPVTSRENQLRGNRIWGLPKVTQRIDIERAGSQCVTTAYEDDGTPYLTLRVPTTGTATDFDVKGWVYSQLDGRVRRAETRFKGRFWVNKHMAMLVRRGLHPERPVLTVGSGPSARPLRELGIDPDPFQFRYTPSMSAAFDLPVEGYDIER